MQKCKWEKERGAIAAATIISRGKKRGVASMQHSKEQYLGPVPFEKGSVGVRCPKWKGFLDYIDV